MISKLIFFVTPFISAILVVYLSYKLILHYRKQRYFNSKEFKIQKEKIKSTIKEYNEISEYAKKIPNNNKFIPYDKKYEYEHLATFENTSAHNYRRDRNLKHLKSRNVRSVSLQIVRRASEEPIKYLCKYFNIKPTEENLKQLEQIGENIVRLESMLNNLKKREEEFLNNFDPPNFIMKHYEDELLEHLGVYITETVIKYETYVFEYVSAGGNSSQRSVIFFDSETIEAVANYISKQIKNNKSVKVQRALMTNKLRNEIKHRDNFTCQSCGISTNDQSLLLLEVDHIIPVSKGGLSTRDNLQTLCWKCNRTKSNKILISEK